MIDKSTVAHTDHSRSASLGGPSRGEGLAETLEHAREFGQALTRRLAAGPTGSLGVLRWIAGYAAWTLVGVMTVVAFLHGRPQAGTLWWLLVLGAELSVLPQAESQKHAVQHWLFIVVIVFALLGMLVFFSAPGDSWWGNVGGSLMIAAALASAPAEWAVFVVKRMAGWITAGLAVVLAWALLTAVGLKFTDPVVAAVDPPALLVWDAVVQGVAALLAAAAAAGALVWGVRQYRCTHGGGSGQC